MESQSDLGWKELEFSSPTPAGRAPDLFIQDFIPSGFEKRKEQPAPMLNCSHGGEKKPHLY